MVWLAGLLVFLEFIEFLTTTPLGLAASLWLSLYWFSTQTLKLNSWISILLARILAIDSLLVKQHE
jgi:amino acid permease